MSRRLVLAIAACLVACSSAPPVKNELAVANDTKKPPSSAAGEGDDGPNGTPTTPSPENGDATPSHDAGAPHPPPPDVDAGSEGPPPDPADPPPPPPPDGSCYSATLMDIEPPGACVQSSTNQLWFQCHEGLWYRGVVGSNGPYGPCTSLHPL